ncbi:50S ribosomal protein L30 [archaeon]|jgi:large subunit ribosomal protein L30|nr:50S ribosomal protein L30 [archaeon]
MIVAIRIHGRVGLKREINETLDRLRLRKKYSCVVLKENPIQEGMVKKVRDFVAYGKINEETFVKLIEARGKLVDSSKKIDAKKIFAEVEAGKKYDELNLKPFFSLHPPRGGIDSKKHFGVKKGVLGDNKDSINKLIERML